MADHPNTHTKQSNLPKDCSISVEDLETMSPAELADTLECTLDTMSEETYDSVLIDAYLDTLDRKAPMPEVPDAKTAFLSFRQRIQETMSASSTGDSLSYGRGYSSKSRRSWWRIVLIAAAMTAFVLGSMVVCQAAGVDVFGAMARWTENVFSFGLIHSDGSQDELLENSIVGSSGDVGDLPVESILVSEQSFSSLQEALDAYGITEVIAPTWFPNEYALERVDIFCVSDPKQLTIDACYSSGSNSAFITIMSYVGEPSMQIEKNDTPIEVFKVGENTFYLITNNRDYTVAWFTEHYECYIGGSAEMSKEVLHEIVYSMFN